MTTYNCKDVIITVNGINLSDKGFSDDGDFVVVTPPTDIADVTQDKSGKYFAVSKNNNGIGEIKFSLMQGSPAQSELQSILKKFRNTNDYILHVIVQNDAEDIKWIMDNGVFVNNPEHSYSTKTNVREWQMKGHVYDEPTIGNGDDVTDVVNDIQGTLVAGIDDIVSGATGSITSGISNAISGGLNSLGGAISDWLV